MIQLELSQEAGEVQDRPFLVQVMSAAYNDTLPIAIQLKENMMLLTGSKLKR